MNEITKENFVGLLQGTGRENIDQLIKYLDENKFYDAPASTKYHGAFKGGLFKHCFCVYHVFSKMMMDYKLDIPMESVIICSFLHDICKVNQYIDTENGYKWNSINPKGHAKLSLGRIKRFIELTPIEEELIKFHMGMYGTYEFATMVGWGEGEYSLKELNDTFNKNKFAKLFYFADDISSQAYEDNIKVGDFDGN